MGEELGSWFEDGLAIDVRPEFIDGSEPDAAAALPARIQVEVSSNVKEDSEFPHAAWIHAVLEGELAENGTLRFGTLKFEKHPWKAITGDN